MTQGVEYVVLGSIVLLVVGLVSEEHRGLAVLGVLNLVAVAIGGLIW